MQYFHLLFRKICPAAGEVVKSVHYRFFQECKICAAAERPQASTALACVSAVGVAYDVYYR